MFGQLILETSEQGNRYFVVVNSEPLVTRGECDKEIPNLSDFVLVENQLCSDFAANLSYFQEHFNYFSLGECVLMTR